MEEEEANPYIAALPEVPYEDTKEEKAAEEVEKNPETNEVAREPSAVDSKNRKIRNTDEEAGEDEEEGEGEEEEEEGEGKPKQKKEKKKGQWTTIGHEPVNYELLPCPDRFKKAHPKDPCPHYKQVRWVQLPISERIEEMAKPSLRRMLVLWMEYGDKFPPEIRDRLQRHLQSKYRLSAPFLQDIAQETRKQNERERESDDKEGGKKKGKKKGKKSKGKKSKKKKKKGKKKKGKKKDKKKKKGKKPKKEGKKKKKNKKGGSDEEDEKPSKPKGKKEKDGGYDLAFRRRKPKGKLPLNWPHKMGSKLLLACIAYLSQDPDEDYNSRANEYFDVQSMAILGQVCEYLDMPLPDPERPTQYGETLVIMSLNLSDWLAKHVTTPAQAIPDDKIQEYLALRGAKPKKKKDKKKEKEKKEKGKKGKKGKKEKEEEPEPEKEPPRNWDELKSPVYVPEKSRMHKRKFEEGDEEEEKELKTAVGNVGYETDGEGEPRWKEPTLDDIKKEFLEYIIWYNPWEPEFMYLGPRRTPVGVSMFNMYDKDSEEVPRDLRVMNWNQIEYGFTENQSFIPFDVPLYYPALRPLRPVRLENLERSGVAKEVLKRNLRFYSPWYLMSKPLKPPQPASSAIEETEAEMAGEFEPEEVLEDEMLTPDRESKVVNSVWGDFKMKEQLEILGHIVHLMATVPDLTMEHLLEMLEEFCDAVECAEEDEYPSKEDRLLLNKRTIILEQYFLEFFGKKFRDYNADTPRYMRTICTRIAYYMQLLYEVTARVLWELQSQSNPPTPRPSRPETPDDPEALRDWDEWFDWLLKVTKTCDEWAGWISETVDEAERKAAKKKNEYIGPDGQPVPLTAEEWYEWKSDVESKVAQYRNFKKKTAKESDAIAKRLEKMTPVKHRKVPLEESEEEEGEVEEEEGERGEEDEGETEEEEIKKKKKKKKKKKWKWKLFGKKKHEEEEEGEEEEEEEEEEAEGERDEEEDGKKEGKAVEDETEWEDVEDTEN